MRAFTPSGSRPTSTPPTVAVPDVGFSSPHSIRIVVDLPAPLLPRKPKISPVLTVNDTWSTATKLPNRRVRSLTTMASGGRGLRVGHGQRPSARSSRASASRTFASACVRSRPACSSATCASSTSVRRRDARGEALARRRAGPRWRRAPSPRPTRRRRGPNRDRAGAGAPRRRASCRTRRAAPWPRARRRGPRRCRPRRARSPRTSRRSSRWRPTTPFHWPARGKMRGFGLARLTPPPTESVGRRLATDASRRSRGARRRASRAPCGRAAPSRAAATRLSAGGDRRGRPSRARRRARSGVSGGSPMSRRRSASVCSSAFRAWMSSICWRDRCASTDSTSFGGTRPTFRRLRTSSSIASIRLTDSSTTRTASVEVTTAQNARVISSLQVVARGGQVEPRRVGFRARGALERVGPAEGVDRPLQVEARPVVVRDVGVEDAERAAGQRDAELLHVVRARVAGLRRHERQPRGVAALRRPPRRPCWRAFSSARRWLAASPRGDRLVERQPRRRSAPRRRRPRRAAEQTVSRAVIVSGVHDAATLLMNTSSSEAGISRTLVTSMVRSRSSPLDLSRGRLALGARAADVHPLAEGLDVGHARRATRAPRWRRPAGARSPRT